MVNQRTVRSSVHGRLNNICDEGPCDEQDSPS